MDAKQIAESLGGAKHHGTYSTARCPSHDDNQASLSLTDKDGKLLVKCHAGCEQATVVEALKAMKLWPTPAVTTLPTARARITAQYNYTDEEGKLLFQALRYDPKGFKQRAPDPDNSKGWVWTLSGVRQVPYRLPELRAGIAAGRTVLIVEGEKDVDALYDLNCVATCNAGGAGKWRSEWAPIFAGAQVCIIPDNDAPGHAHAAQVAKLLLPTASKVCIAILPGVPEKEDISWWLANGGTRDGLAGIVKAALATPYTAATSGPPVSKRPPSLGVVEPSGAVRAPITEPVADDTPLSIAELHQRLNLVGKAGHAKGTLDNVMRVLEGHRPFLGRFYYDDFHGTVFSSWGADNPTDYYKWTDADTLRLQLTMQRECGLQDVRSNAIEDGLQILARRRTTNEVMEWLETLVWDNEPRLERLMFDAFGAESNDYTCAVGRCWLVSMVARAYRGGCQVDTMPIFEGCQGVGKTQALRIIGGKWYSECHESIQSKDFLQSLAGAWLVEISELHAFKRADVERIKGIITTRIDRYRPSYGRRVQDFPRRAVFAGTTNRDTWQTDDTGGRRFWPIEARALDLEYLKECREQLFAEAVTLFKAGASWWDVDTTLAAAEVEKRFEIDEWEGLLKTWLRGRDVVDYAQCMDAIGIKPSDWDRAIQIRVGSILRRMGFKSSIVYRDGITGRAWKRSKR